MRRLLINGRIWLSMPALYLVWCGSVFSDEPSEITKDRNNQVTAGGFIISAPGKKNGRGEDAFFISDDNHCFGVADGVGSWSLKGVDAGLFSRCLMKKSKEIIRIQREACILPDCQDFMHNSHKACQEFLGSSTYVSACFEDDTNTRLNICNLGDSVAMVLRPFTESVGTSDNHRPRWRFVMRTKEQQHRFNAPFQLAGGGAYGDEASSCDKYTVDIQKGDVLVLASDGVMDNIFNKELEDWMQKNGDTFVQNRDAQGLAEHLAHYAQRQAHRTDDGPFAKGHNDQQIWGAKYHGGKPDDITVVAALIV